MLISLASMLHRILLSFQCWQRSYLSASHTALALLLLLKRPSSYQMCISTKADLLTASIMLMLHVRLLSIFAVVFLIVTIFIPSLPRVSAEYKHDVQDHGDSMLATHAFSGTDRPPALNKGDKRRNDRNSRRQAPGNSTIKSYPAHSSLEFLDTLPDRARRSREYINVSGLISSARCHRFCLPSDLTVL